MAFKLAREIERVKECKTISKKNYPVKQLEGDERIRFIARCYIRKYSEHIWTLKSLISTQEMSIEDAELVIKLVEEWKNVPKMQR